MARPPLNLTSTILNLLPDHPKDLGAAVAAKTKVSRQTVSAHLRKLEELGWITSTGTTRKTYLPGKNRHRQLKQKISAEIDESQIWQTHFESLTSDLKPNIRQILEHGFTEMVNNVKDHSGGRTLHCSLVIDPESIFLLVIDDGEGIFKRIKRLCDLTDERLALLELAKGKLTTDPKNHSGEGIFFTSRAFERFVIASGGLVFTHDPHADWLDEVQAIHSKPASIPGTVVFMGLGRESEHDLASIFDRFAAPDEYNFSKTIVPLRMARLGNENLISRSQAKRALSRVDRFKTVIFDFTEVETIGQAFADEIFRVFANSHPEVELIPTHFNEPVRRMLMHVGVAAERLRQAALKT